jgi:hypothetical protein
MDITEVEKDQLTIQKDVAMCTLHCVTQLQMLNTKCIHCLKVETHLLNLKVEHQRPSDLLQFGSIACSNLSRPWPPPQCTCLSLEARCSNEHWACLNLKTPSSRHNDDDDDGLPKYMREAGEIEWHFAKNEDQTNFSWTTILHTKISQNRNFLKPTTVVEN